MQFYGTRSLEDVLGQDSRETDDQEIQLLDEQLREDQISITDPSVSTDVTTVCEELLEPCNSVHSMQFYGTRSLEDVLGQDSSETDDFDTDLVVKNDVYVGIEDELIASEFTNILPDEVRVSRTEDTGSLSVTDRHFGEVRVDSSEIQIGESEEPEENIMSELKLDETYMRHELPSDDSLLLLIAHAVQEEKSQTGFDIVSTVEGSQVAVVRDVTDDSGTAYAEEQADKPVVSQSAGGEVFVGDETSLPAVAASVTDIVVTLVSETVDDVILLRPSQDASLEHGSPTDESRLVPLSAVESDSDRTAKTSRNLGSSLETNDVEVSLTVHDIVLEQLSADEVPLEMSMTLVVEETMNVPELVGDAKRRSVSELSATETQNCELMVVTNSEVYEETVAVIDGVSRRSEENTIAEPVAVHLERSARNKTETVEQTIAVIGEFTLADDVVEHSGESQVTMGLIQEIKIERKPLEEKLTSVEASQSEVELESVKFITDGEVGELENEVTTREAFSNVTIREEHQQLEVSFPVVDTKQDVVRETLDKAVPDDEVLPTEPIVVESTRVSVGQDIREVREVTGRPEGEDRTSVSDEWEVVDRVQKTEDAERDGFSVIEDSSVAFGFTQTTIAETTAAEQEEEDASLTEKWDVIEHKPTTDEDNDHVFSAEDESSYGFGFTETKFTKIVSNRKTRTKFIRTIGDDGEITESQIVVECSDDDDDEDEVDSFAGGADFSDEDTEDRLVVVTRKGEADDERSAVVGSITVFTSTVEDDPDIETEMEEYQDELPDGTIVRRRVTTTHRRQTVTKRVVLEGLDEDDEGLHLLRPFSTPATDIREISPAGDDDVIGTLIAGDGGRLMSEASSGFGDGRHHHHLTRYADRSCTEPELSTEINTEEGKTEDGRPMKKRTTTKRTQQLTTERLVVSGDRLFDVGGDDEDDVFDSLRRIGSPAPKRSVADDDLPSPTCSAAASNSC